MTFSTSVEQDFQDAQFGRGTRYLTHEDASALLDHCERLGWAFQFMESFECVGEKELDRVDLSILGLTHAENSASSLADLTAIARERLALARAERNPFLFQIWVDTADSVIAKRRRARSKR